MVQLIVLNLKTKREEVLYINSKDTLEDKLDSCCPKYEKNPTKGTKYKVLGATYDTKSESEILKPYLFDKKDNGDFED